MNMVVSEWRWVLFIFLADQMEAIRVCPYFVSICVCLYFAESLLELHLAQWKRIETI